MSRIIVPLLFILLAPHPYAEERFSLMAPRLNPLQLPTQQAVAWATPLQGGPIEVFAVTPEYAGHDLEELATRLDLKLDQAPVWSRTIAAANDDNTRAFHQRLAKGLDKKPDVIILGNVDWATLPVEWLDRLVAYVRAGHGLLLSHVHGSLPPELLDCLHALPDTSAEAVARGIAASITPEWKRDLDFLSAGVCGEGRVVRLDYAEPAAFQALLPALTDAFFAEEAYRETYLALVVRAMVWLAAREPDSAIVSIASTAITGPREEEIPPDLPPEYVQAMKDSVIQPLVHPFVARLSKPAPERYTVRAQIRVPGRDLQMAWPLTATVDKGDTTYGFAVPVGIGRYFLDLWLYDTGREPRVVDWYSEAITIEGWPSIAKFECSKASVNANDSIDVSIEVPPQLRRMAETALAGQIVVRATDTFDRVVAEKRETLTAEGGQFTILMDFVDLAGNRIKVEVFASDRPGASFTGGSLHNTAYDYTYLTVATPPRETLRLVTQGPLATEYGVLPMLAHLKGLGVDGVAGPENVQTAFLASQENVWLLPLVDVLRTDAGRACPNDPAHWQTTMATLGGIPGIYLSMGSATFFVDAATEGHSQETCPLCRDALREFLRGLYDDVNAINAAWHTRFVSWSEVMFPASPGTEDSWAPYVDVQRFRERVLGNACILGQAALQSGAPSARVGTVLPAVAPVRDIWFFATQLNALTVPQDPVDVEKLRSYRIPQSFAAAAYGAHGSKAYGGWLPGYTAFHGMSAIWLTDVYTDSAHASADPAMSPSWEPSESLSEIARQTTALRRGLATVFAEAKRESYGIAIYDSPVSGDVNAAAPGWYADRRESEDRFIRIVESLGYQYDFICHGSIEEGVLPEYRVLILPAVWSLSDAEIETIRAFHRAGGVVIADGVPGRYDEHGRRRDDVPLAELFGATVNGAMTPDTIFNTAALVALENETVDATLETVQVDGAVQGDDGRRLWLWRADPSPALLLNHRVDDDTDDATARLLAAVLHAQGFVPAASPTGKKHRRFDGEVVSWTYGPARLVGFLRRPEGDGREKFDANLHLGGFVYDLSTGERLHKPEKLSVTMAPGGMAVFSALPYEVTGLEVQPASTRLFPGQPLRVAVAVKTKEGLPGRHLVWVELVNPGGDVLEPYTRGILCVGGLGEVRIPLASNEALGFYTVRARDVLTGIEASATVEVTLP